MSNAVYTVAQYKDMQALATEAQAELKLTKQLYSLEKQKNYEINALKIELLNSRIKSLEEQNAFLVGTFKSMKKND